MRKESREGRETPDEGLHWGSADPTLLSGFSADAAPEKASEESRTGSAAETAASTETSGRGAISTLLLGVVLGLYGLYTLGWLKLALALPPVDFGALNFGDQDLSLLVFLFYYANMILAVLASPLWLLISFRLFPRPPRGLSFRWVAQLLGLLLLLPWGALR